MKKVPDLTICDDIFGRNLLDIIVLYNRPKEIVLLVADKFIQDGGQFTKFHLIFALTIGFEQEFIKKLKNNAAVDDLDKIFEKVKLLMILR